MPAGSIGAAAVVATVGEAIIAVFIAFIGIQLYTTSRTSKSHLANAVALAPRIARSVQNRLPPLSPPPPGVAQERAAGSVDSVGDDESAQIVVQLNEYFAANISQGYAIFWASLLSTIVGFVIVLAGIEAAGTSGTTAIVAGVAGVLSQFIAATFLVALRSTQQQSTVYAQTLADLHVRDERSAADARAIELGLRLLSEISGDGAGALVNATRAALAMGLILKDTAPAAQTPAAPAPVTVDVDDPRRSQPPTRAASVTFDQTLDAPTQASPKR